MPSDFITISKEIEFDAGHRVPNHKSKCRNPHGHRYRVRVWLRGSIVQTPGASDEGMLQDFSDLKTIMTEVIHDYFDHGFIVYVEDDPLRQMFDNGAAADWKIIIFPYIPTAENIAKWIWGALEFHYPEEPGTECLRLHLVEVWETPTSRVAFAGGAYA